jgi:hypothetical protein
VNVDFGVTSFLFRLLWDACGVCVAMIDASIRGWAGTVSVNE